MGNFWHAPRLISLELHPDHRHRGGALTNDATCLGRPELAPRPLRTPSQPRLLIDEEAHP
jgi:hypothetical protein